MTGVLILGCAVAASFVLAHRRFGGALTSPVQLVAGGLAALAVGGYLFYDAVAGAAGGAGIAVHLRADEPREALELVLTFALAVLVGAVALSLLFARAPTAVRAATAAAEVPPGILRAALVLAPAPLVALVALRGEEIWHRPEYIAQHVGGSVLVAGLAQLTLPASAVLGFLWTQGVARAYVGLVYLGYLTVQFGLGSRRLSLLIVLFALGCFLAKPGRGTRAGLVVAGLVAFFSLSIPLTMRSGSEHGVAPYWHRLPEVVDGSLPLETTALNLLVGFALIHLTAFGRPPIAEHDMWVAVNPLPGGMVGWGEIIDDHRLNFFAPYAGIGELGNAGTGWVWGVGLAVGAVLAVLDLRARRYADTGRHVVSLAVLGLSTLFMLFLTQYTLRASMRMLYYAVAVVVIAEVWGVVRGAAGAVRRPGPSQEREPRGAGSRA